MKWIELHLRSSTDDRPFCVHGSVLDTTDSICSIQNSLSLFVSLGADLNVFAFKHNDKHWISFGLTQYLCDIAGVSLRL